MQLGVAETTNAAHVCERIIFYTLLRVVILHVPRRRCFVNAAETVGVQSDISALVAVGCACVLATHNG